MRASCRCGEGGADERAGSLYQGVAAMAEIKVCEPVSVPVSVLQELQELRALPGQLQKEV
jgi:hypothetical protein